MSDKYSAEYVEYEGKYPFKQFLEILNDDEEVEVYASIDILIEMLNNNNRIPEKLSKSLKDGIFELRVKHFNRISRCLYFFVKGKKIYFTNGFIKKTQKTPINEIEKAIKLKKYHLSKEK